MKVSATRIAFKEWATVIRALETGRQTLLLRKGGISEAGGKFQLQHRAFLLYPTYEHQYLDMLQPRYHDLMRRTNAEAPPIDRTRITGYAEVTDVFEVKDPETALALKDHFVWNEEWVRSRFKFKPDWPLYGMVLRAYRLPELVEMPFRKEYGGCKSWVELEQDISVEGIQPALQDGVYRQRLELIETYLNHEKVLPR